MNTTLNIIDQNIKDSLLIRNYFSIYNPMTTYTIPCLLTEKQKSFLMNNFLLDIIKKDTSTFTFMNSLFSLAGNNNPINEPLFLRLMFEFINLFLYLYKPNEIIPTLNKLNNLKDLPQHKNNIDNLTILNAGFKFNINPLSKTLSVAFKYVDGSDTMFITYKEPFNYAVTIYAKEAIHNVDNTNDFLFKIIDVYNEFIELMPQEELVLDS